MELNDIQKLVGGVVDLWKDKKGGWKESKELPDYYPTYQTIVEQMEHIRVHAVKGVFPDKLIAKRSPNQTDAEFIYVKENYKQITLPVFIDLISTIQRAFSDNNWSIEYSVDEAEDSLINYVTQGLKETPLKMSLEEWMKGVLPAIKLIDANGVVAVKPYYIPTIETEDGVVISGERFEPVPFYYESAQVVAYDEGDWYLIELKEKSEVTIGNRTEKSGLIYEFYDKDAIWRIEQTGAKKDYKFNYIPYYVHEFGEVPITRLKGRAHYEEGELIWSSEFLSVVDILDDAVLDGCNLRGIKATCVYPYRVMTGSACENTLNLNGEVQCCNGTGYFNDYTLGKKIECSGCGGTGLKDRISPYGVMLLRPGNIEQDGELKATQPAMYYVSPSIDTPEFLRTEIEKHINQARGILHLRNTSSEVQPSDNETATGQQLDQKALYSFIKGISDQCFEIYADVIKWITWMRYGTDYPLPIITPPITFDLKDEQAYLEDIGKAVENGVPSSVVSMAINRYMSAVFYNEGEAGQIQAIVNEADRLLTVPSEEIALKETRGIIAKWEVVLHDSGYQLVKELMRENPSFLELELNDQISQLILKAQSKANQIKGIGSEMADQLGKLPLAVQQISLAIDRMRGAGDETSANLLTAKLKELTKDIGNA